MAQLCDGEATLRLLRRTPIVESRLVGVFSLHDVEIATGEVSVAEGDEHPEMSTIEAAFLDTELEELQATATAVRESIEGVEALEVALTEQVGVANATSFVELLRVLKQIDQILTSQLTRRGVSDTPEEEPSEEATASGGESAGGGPGQRLTGDITSREDVIKALDKICEYYNRFEPSSPLPLLLKRAKRLATKGFLEILRDLTPDALDQAKALGGVEEEVAAQSGTDSSGSSGGGESSSSSDDGW
jgi:type VI secretion system protein ImpA